MTQAGVQVVTGAFGFTGHYITKHLLNKGYRVRTLTSRQRPIDGSADQIEVAPLSFADPAKLVESLRGADVLYNTYWVRYPHGKITHDLAVQNSRILFDAASTAGVRRIVHISITQPDESSPFTYFRGKALVERALIESGISYAILRPAVYFGGDEILINNIAWMLRKFPIFGIIGDGQYRLQPTHIEDVAALAAREGAGATNTIIDAVGPETFTYRELIERVRRAIGSKTKLINVSTTTALLIARAIGLFVGDVIITRQEIDALAADVLVSLVTATCPIRFTDWLKSNSDSLGRQYHSEIRRHFA